MAKGDDLTIVFRHRLQSLVHLLLHLLSHCVTRRSRKLAEQLRRHKYGTGIGHASSPERHLDCRISLGLAQMETAARAIHDLGPSWVLIKGGRAEEDVVDLLFDGRQPFWFRSARIETSNTHGSGDTLSAAICAFRAQGMEMGTAVEKARRFTTAAIRGGASWRLGAGHGPVSHW